MWIQCGSHTANDYTEKQNVHSYIYIQICCGVIRCSWNNAWLNTCTHGVHWCRDHSVEVCCPTGEVGRGVVQPLPAKPRGACDSRYHPNSCLIPHRMDSGPMVPKACRESSPKTRLATTIMPNWTHWPLARKRYLWVLGLFYFVEERDTILRQFKDGRGGWMCVRLLQTETYHVTLQHRSHLLLFWPNQNASVYCFLAHWHKCYHQSQHTSIK